MHIYQYQSSTTVTEAGNTDNFAYGALLTYERERQVIFLFMKAFLCKSIEVVYEFVIIGYRYTESCTESCHISGLSFVF